MSRYGIHWNVLFFEVNEYTRLKFLFLGRRLAFSYKKDIVRGDIFELLVKKYGWISVTICKGLVTMWLHTSTLNNAASRPRSREFCSVFGINTIDLCNGDALCFLGGNNWLIVSTILAISSCIPPYLNSSKLNSLVFDATKLSCERPLIRK
jgi:hypothetical protein